MTEVAWLVNLRQIFSGSQFDDLHLDRQSRRYLTQVATYRTPTIEIVASDAKSACLVLLNPRVPRGAQAASRTSLLVCEGGLGITQSG